MTSFFFQAQTSAGPSNQDVHMLAPRDDDKKKEIYRYDAPFTLYATAWSAAIDPQRRFRLAVSSFVEEYSNKVSDCFFPSKLLFKISILQLDEEQGEIVYRSSFDHPYPATKIGWIPDSKGNYPDLVATSGDYLRVWRVRLVCIW